MTCCDITYFPHHALHLPGAAGTVPHKAWIIDFFVCHLGLVTVLVVQIVALLALDQLVSHCHCHLSLAMKNTTASQPLDMDMHDGLVLEFN